MIDFSRVPDLCMEALGNWQAVVLSTAIIVCSVIATLGGLKFGLIDKIKNKLVRKIVLAFSSLALILPTTAILFLISGYSFDIYWYSVFALMPVEVVVYWLYENTGLRNAINKLGSFCCHKILVAFCASVVDDDNKRTRERLVATNKELKDYAKETVKSVLVTKNKEVDKDLENL